MRLFDFSESSSLYILASGEGTQGLEQSSSAINFQVTALKSLTFSSNDPAARKSPLFENYTAFSPNAKS
jgi:hypothetical protein